MANTRMKPILVDRLPGGRPVCDALFLPGQSLRQDVRLRREQVMPRPPDHVRETFQGLSMAFQAPVALDGFDAYSARR